MEKELNEIKAINLELKTEARKLGHGFLTKKIKRKDTVIEKLKNQIRELESRDNLKYQLEIQYPKHNSTIKKCLRKLDEYLGSDKSIHHPERVQILNSN